MFHDIDESLKKLIRREALNGTDIDVVLDAPTKEWSSRRNAPTLDVYLYDIREDMRRREVGLIDVHDEEGRVTERRKPPRHYKMSYLVTAWTQRPEDEHRLLAGVLACFLRYDRLPQDVLSGSLVSIDLPIQVNVALPPPEDRSLSDVWSALGGELKPSLDLVVIAPFDTRQVQAAGPPVLESPRLEVYAGGAGPEERTRAGRRGSGRSKEDGSSPARSKPALSDEKIQAGGDDAPGRIFQVREIDGE
jgi:hypothetical protein